MLAMDIDNCPWLALLSTTSRLDVHGSCHHRTCENQAHNPLAELADGIASLRACGSIEGYRSAFTHISAGIHVAGTPDGHAAMAPA